MALSVRKVPNRHVRSGEALRGLQLIAEKLNSIPADIEQSLTRLTSPRDEDDDADEEMNRKSESPENRYVRTRLARRLEAWRIAERILDECVNHLPSQLLSIEATRRFNDLARSVPVQLTALSPQQMEIKSLVAPMIG